MIKPYLRHLTLVLFAAASLPAFAAFDVAQLMNDLAQHKGGRAKFVELLTDRLAIRGQEIAAERTAAHRPSPLGVDKILQQDW